MSVGTLVLPPFVASAIVEHAKRRCNAAGYLVGVRSGNQITVADYIPCTHVSTAEVRNRAYIEELEERITLKKNLTPGIMLIGWYAAGAPEEGQESDFDLWCQAPGASFSRVRSNNQAVMLLCRMPTAKDMSLRWDACVTRNCSGADTFTCERARDLTVSIEAEAQSVNVLLAEMVSKALYDGSTPYPSSWVTNLDRIALEAEREAALRRDSDSRPVEAALVSAQNKLRQAISHARASLAGGSRSQKGQMAGSAAIMESYDLIVAEKNRQGSRDDFITENYKDALMMKYMSALLRRHVSDIERHARYEGKEKVGHGLGHGHGHAQGHGHGHGRGRGGGVQFGRMPNFR